MNTLFFTRSYLGKIAPFFVILLVLLVFCGIFNAFFDWKGVDLILRVYVYALCFLMIFSVFSIKNRNFAQQYARYYGERKGRIVLGFESRVLPFFLIYFIIILFGLTSSIGSNLWPSGILVNFMEGKYTNLMMYCLFLSLILRYQENPIAAAGLFIGSLIAFYWVDYFFQRNISYGSGYSVYKILKLVFFFFFVIWDSTRSVISIFRSVLFSFLMGVGVFAASVGYLYAKYKFENPEIPAKANSGLILARMGFPVALDYLAVNSFLNKKYNSIVALDQYFDVYNRTIPLSETEWEQLLFSGRMKDAEKISGLILKNNIPINSRKLIDFAYSKTMSDKESLQKLPMYTLLTSRMLPGHEEDLMRAIEMSGREFTIWGIQVLGLVDSEKAILFLVRYLSNVDQAISEIAYAALRNITGKDPARETGQNINSPEVIKYFKDIYLYRGNISE